MTVHEAASNAEDSRPRDGFGEPTLSLDAVATSLDALMGRWVQLLRRTSGAAVAAFCRHHGPHRLVRIFTARQGSPAEWVELAPSESLASRVRATGLTDSTGSQEYAEAPVIVDGRVAGQLAVGGPGPLGWAPDLAGLLADVAAAVAAQLTLHLAQAQLERSQLLGEAHHRIHHLIAQGAPLPDVLHAICETIESYDSTLIPCVLLLDSATGTLHSGVGRSLPPEYLAATDGLVIGPTIGTCGPAAWFGELTISRDLFEDPNWTPVLDLVRQVGVRHCWSMPVKGIGGQVLGTLAFYGRDPRDPRPEHLVLLEDWSRIAGIAIERSRSLERLTYDARHDSLTGLPNRVAIFEELDEAIGRAGPRAPVAVLFIDLDGLKSLNDTLGHDRADEMIRQIGLRLRDTVRDGDFVGRFGGDEFLVIAERLVGTGEAEALGKQLLEAVSRPLPGGGASLVVTASIGIAVIRSDAVEAREAIRRSDAAMYEAKRSGRDRCVVFGAVGAAHVGRRLQVARLLRGAETRGELSLLFQPIIGLDTMTVVGVEALLRWENSVVGQVSPVEFIPIAEDTGSIMPIGAWALRESCEAIAALAELGRSLELAVNVSARQVCNPDFAVWVRKTLSHAQVEPDRLRLEITETALMRPNAMATDSLGELDAVGIQFVLDDFGTGHSSLSWLKQHRFGAIKIDHSFIRGLPDDPGDRAIVGGVIGMARALGCTVTAEGVETPGQLSVLRELGCERVQGFLMLEPVPLSDLRRVLQGPPPWAKGPTRHG